MGREALNAPGTDVRILAVIFDLDGVIVTTDEYHYLAWKSLADTLGIPFDRDRNQALRGVGRMESLELILGPQSPNFTPAEKEALADRKNREYQAHLQRLDHTAILPGASRVISELRHLGTRIAVASASKNAPTILDNLGIRTWFDAVVDGNRITRSKPDPEIFLLAAADLGVENTHCTVVEDAFAGIDAALAAGMKAFGVGHAASHPSVHGSAPSLASVSASDLLFAV